MSSSVARTGAPTLRPAAVPSPMERVVVRIRSVSSSSSVNSGAVFVAGLSSAAADPHRQDSLRLLPRSPVVLVGGRDPQVLVDVVDSGRRSCLVGRAGDDRPRRSARTTASTAR